MEFAKLIICSILGAFVIVFAGFLIRFLNVRRNVFPYSNMSVLWVILLLISVLMHQAIWTAMIYFDYFDCPYLFSLLKSFNSYLIHYFTSFPLIARAYILSVRIKFNYYHLSDKVYDQKFQKKSDKIFKSYYYSEKNRVIKKFIFFTVSFLMISFIIFMLFTPTRCFVFYYSTFGFSAPEECHHFLYKNSTDHKSTILLWILSVELFLNFLEIFIFLTLIFNVLKYPIKSDKFKIRMEMFIIFIIWSVYHNSMHGYQMYFVGSNLFVLSLINFFQNISFIMLYIYLIYVRERVDKSEFLGIIQNFDSFMHNHLCFSFFKEYLKNYFPDCSNYLLFWVDYYIYKQQVTNYGQIALQCIINNACCMYEDYFRYNESLVDTSVNPSVSGDFKAGATFIIDFPVDIQENVEDVVMKNFNVEYQMIKELFDDAYLFVNDKLYNIYLSMCKNEKEYRKMEVLISFLDFNEIKNQHALSRKTTSFMA